MNRVSHLAAVLLLFSTVFATAAEKPNIILIVADNLGYGDVGCYGSKVNRTPNLDQMAAEGMKLTGFYVGSSVCTPSRAAFMTGCYPARVSMEMSGTRRVVLQPVAQKGLAPGEVTIAEVLRDAGYATHCIGKWHLGDQLPFLPTRQGFEGWLGVPYSEDMVATTAPRLGEMWPPVPLVRDETTIDAPVDPDTLTKRYTEEAVTYIEKNKDRPFFLYLPHAVPGSSITAFASEEFRKRSQNGIYGACIEELDWSMGELFAALKKNGIDEKTLVIWTSDNGAFQGNRRVKPLGQNTPLRGTGGTPYEGGFRVPCLVRWPGHVAAGSESEELVTSMDLLPTVAGLADTEVPTHRKIDGKDAWPVISGEKEAKSPHDRFYYYRTTQLQAVRSGKWKLHLPVNRTAIAPRAKNAFAKRELYDLSVDKEEQNNLADQHPDIVAQLMAIADKGRAELGDFGRLGSGQRPAGWVDNVEAFRLPGLPSLRSAPTDAEALTGPRLGLSLFETDSASGWAETSAVSLDPEDRKKFFVSPVEGDLVVHNTALSPDGKQGAALTTSREFGDIELHAEFLISEGSNSGIYVMGRYEVQILDSFGKPDGELSVHDCAAIYERWNEDEPDKKKRGYEGSKPSSNATRPAGEWQSLDITFRAPRFDESGKKIADATFVEVKLNGVVVQENVNCSGPTRGGLGKEVAQGPLRIQGDHGPVAFRNIWIREN